MTHKLDLKARPTLKGTGYPPPHDTPCKERLNQPLGLAAGLTQFGVNLTRLKPGVWSSQRHWHSEEDEFVWVLEGEAVLVTEDSRETFRAGECVGFIKGVENGHHFINESEIDAVLLTIGGRSNEDTCHYPDIDLQLKPGRYSALSTFVHKDGTPYGKDS